MLGSGLINMGNTCFFNATIQCILHAQPLCLELKARKHSARCHPQEWCVYCEMEGVYTATKTSKVFEPRKLVLNLKKLFKKFRLGRQQDSHEFLRYFVEGLQKADLHTKEKNQEKLRVMTQKSRVFNIFGGVMKSSVQCETCDHKSEIQEHFYDLILECQKSNTLHESLSNFFRIDHLTGSNKYRCDHCKKLSNANKRFIFHQLPQILTIQLKRFTNNLHKLGKFVQFPETLQLQKYSDVKEPSIYDLYAIVIHVGSTSFSGHYYSYVRVGLNWYKMDDSSVYKVERETVFNQKAYLLFYERREEAHLQEENKEPVRRSIEVSREENTKQTDRQVRRESQQLNKQPQTSFQPQHVPETNKRNHSLEGNPETPRLTTPLIRSTKDTHQQPLQLKKQPQQSVISKEAPSLQRRDSASKKYMMKPARFLPRRKSSFNKLRELTNQYYMKLLVQHALNPDTKSDG